MRSEKMLKPQMNADERRYRSHEHGASFDKLRMRGSLDGTKKDPHPELVEGRTVPIPGSPAKDLISWDRCTDGRHNKHLRSSAFICGFISSRCRRAVEVRP